MLFAIIVAAGFALLTISEAAAFSMKLPKIHIDIPKPKDIIKGNLPNIDIDVGGGHRINMTPLGPTIDGIPLGPNPSPELVSHCVQHPKDCVENLPEVALYELAKTVINTYRASLTAQVGSWDNLPENFVVAAQPYYRTDLHTVQYATGVNTLHGDAITFSTRVFFPRSINFGNKDDVHWVLHEIRHTDQYAHNGGEEKFLGFYIHDAAEKIISSGRINIHDNLTLEQDAEQAAINLTDGVFSDMTRPAGALLRISNKCNYGLRIYVAYDGPQGLVWEGGYDFAPNESDSLEGNDGGEIRVSGDYVYTQVVDESGRDWGGDVTLTVDGQTHTMMRTPVRSLRSNLEIHYCGDSQ